MGVSSRGAASQAGEFRSPHPRPGPPSRPSLPAGRRLSRATVAPAGAGTAAVDDVVGDARVLGDAEHIVPGAEYGHARNTRAAGPATAPPPPADSAAPVPASPLLRVEIAATSVPTRWAAAASPRATPPAPAPAAQRTGSGLSLTAAPEMAAAALSLPTGNDVLWPREDAGKGTTARHWEKGK